MQCDLAKCQRRQEQVEWPLSKDCFLVYVFPKNVVYHRGRAFGKAFRFNNNMQNRESRRTVTSVIQVLRAAGETFAVNFCRVWKS